jgi:hypothetical protein
MSKIRKLVGVSLALSMLVGMTLMFVVLLEPAPVEAWDCHPAEYIGCCGGMYPKAKFQQVCVWGTETWCGAALCP